MSDQTFNIKLQCKSCCEEIFNNSRVAIRCVECKDIDLCPECFASKVELGTHSPNHAYRLIENGGFRIFKTDWSVSEHIKLLKCIEQYGYGNWEDIARALNAPNDSGPVWKQRSPSDIKDEYCNIFLHSSLGRHSWKEADRGRAKDHTQSKGVLQGQNEAPTSLTIHESIMLGYMPKRDDFEVEFDNDSEVVVSQLEEEFSNSSGSTEEDELVKALNVAHVEAYKVKLRERERRKRVARDHSLVSEFFKENPVFGEKKATNGSSKSKRPKDPTFERLKILSEYQSAKDHQAFMVGVTKEKEIKSRIKDIMRFRKNGIVKMSDSVEFEVQRLRRNNKKKSEKRRLQQNAILGEAAAEMNLQLVHSPMSIKSEDFSTTGSTVPSPMASSIGGAAASPIPKCDELPQLSSLPGYDILSTNEKKLCANLRLTPANYMSYKTCLLTNHLQKKKGQTPKPLNPVGLDKNNRKIIFNFLMRAGWITAY